MLTTEKKRKTLFVSAHLADKVAFRGSADTQGQPKSILDTELSRYILMKNVGI